jgi:CheY-like chemotaxis protein
MNYVIDPNEDNQLAEGAQEHSDVPEPSHIRQPVTVPAIRVRRNESPAGETGMLPAVRVQAESTDNNDVQDASRTTAEVNPALFPQPAKQVPPYTRPLILIVEDQTMLAELIQITLQRMKLESVIETHGGKALARYLELRPDMVLLDLGLPDMKGWQLLDSIKASLVEGETMPIVVVITAFGDASNRLVGRFQNVAYYLVKPFTSEEVSQVVRQALNGTVG